MKTFQETDVLVIFNRKSGEISTNKILSKSVVYKNVGKLVIDLSIEGNCFNVPAYSGLGYLGDFILSTSKMRISLELEEQTEHFKTLYEMYRNEYDLFLSNVKS